MRKLLYLGTFFIITPVTLIASLIALSLLSPTNPSSPPKVHQIGSLNTPRHGSQVYAALPREVGEVAGIATAADARIEIIRQYLERYSSPLEPHASDIIDSSEKYNLDFRLLVAIAQQESNLCKKAPSDSYNCWGWGVHSKGTLRFTDYPEAIDAVARGLREDYFDKGYTTPEEIMSKYTPLSPGTWALGVRQFLAEME